MVIVRRRDEVVAESEFCIPRVYSFVLLHGFDARHLCWVDIAPPSGARFSFPVKLAGLPLMAIPDGAVDILDHIDLPDADLRYHLLRSIPRNRNQKQ